MLNVPTKTLGFPVRVRLSWVVIVLTAIITLTTTTPNFAGQVFFTDFESGVVPTEFVGSGGTIQGTEGYGALSDSSGLIFDSKFWRYDSALISPTTLTLTGLPTHDHVSISFALAVIDSWDNDGLKFTLDGIDIQSIRWSLAVPPTSFSYARPAAAAISEGTDLGFAGGSFYKNDLAWDFSKIPFFQNIPHTASTLTFQIIELPGGAGWQGGFDESWAIDRLSVTTINSASVPEPSSLTLGICAVGVMFGMVRLRRSPGVR